VYCFLGSAKQQNYVLEAEKGQKMGLLAEDRQQHILNLVHANSRVEVAALARELGVTEITIRRDLAVLHKLGLVKKTYGGAVPTPVPEMNLSVKFRQTRNLSAKKIIGRLATDLIENGDVIFLEAGSTCYEIIPHLVRFENLTIIVNSLYLLSRLHELTRHRIIITGGLYRPDRMDMVGPTAEAAISQLSGFKAFTGADDITIDAGISGGDVVTVGFAKIIAQRATQLIFVGDHTKFDNPALYKIIDIGEIDHIVTDIAPSQEWHDAMREKNIKLVYPR
jgi:DeoR/GlpR family transcriptional regulator of sugar metabolism